MLVINADAVILNCNVCMHMVWEDNQIAQRAYDENKSPCPISLCSPETVIFRF